MNILIAILEYGPQPLHSKVLKMYRAILRLLKPLVTINTSNEMKGKIDIINLRWISQSGGEKT